MNKVELLTPALAAEWVSEEGPGLHADMAMDDIIHGRTACVRVMSEDECRAEFIKWARGAYEERQCVFDPQGVFFNPEVAVRWGAWLACARAMGAVSEKKG